MKKIIIALMILGSTGCNNQVSNPKGTPTPGGNQVPNPASQNCIQKGAKLEIREGTAGQTGFCIFNDGSECEEWAFYRGTCQQGQKK